MGLETFLSDFCNTYDEKYPPDSITTENFRYHIATNPAFSADAAGHAIECKDREALTLILGIISTNKDYHERLCSMVQSILEERSRDKLLFLVRSLTPSDLKQTFSLLLDSFLGTAKGEPEGRHQASHQLGFLLTTLGAGVYDKLDYENIKKIFDFGLYAQNLSTLKFALDAPGFIQECNRSVSLLDDYNSRHLYFNMFTCIAQYERIETLDKLLQLNHVSRFIATSPLAREFALTASMKRQSPQMLERLLSITAQPQPRPMLPPVPAVPVSELGKKRGRAWNIHDSSSGDKAESHHPPQPPAEGRVAPMEIELPMTYPQASYKHGAISKLSYLPG